MIDNLYYGGKPCACCSGSPRNDLGEVIFSADILEDFLRKIYDGFDVSREIEPSAWREVLRILNEGAVKGLTQGGERQHTPQFLQAIKHSNEVFSAFKCHSMGVKMAERLRDKDGNLRPFKEWREAVQPIASHHVGAWLKTEYDTAVLRAHQGSLWQEFERNKDILPNLRWMPTTSVSPENVHKGYWTSRLTLPVDDPFWQDNHPANRWNCKCSLEATSDKADTGHVAEMARQDNTAQQGLENNPRDGRLFSDKHPYFPDSCSSCPFKKQSKLKNWIGRLFNSGEGKEDCYNCPYANRAITEAELKEKYPLDKWEHTYVSDNGGYLVTELQRKEETKGKDGKVVKQELEVFVKEQTISKDLANMGHRIEHLAEKNRDDDTRYDVRFNGTPADLKSTKSINNIVDYAKTAFRKQGAEMVIYRFEQRLQGIENTLKSIRKLFPTGRIVYYYDDDKKLIEYP